MYICNVATTTTDRDSIAYTERVESMYFAKVHSPLGLKTPHEKRVDESKGQVTNNQEERKNSVLKSRKLFFRT